MTTQPGQQVEGPRLATEAPTTVGTAFTRALPLGHSRRAAFLDRDGVINIDHGYTSQVADFHFVPGSLEACAVLHGLGFALVVVTNQSGIGRGRYSVADFLSLNHWMQARFADADAPLSAVYYCPHHPTDAIGQWRTTCACRKPAPAMFLKAASDLGLDMPGSIVFGDRDGDLQAALAAGVGTRIRLASNGVSFDEDASGHAPRDKVSAPEPLEHGRYLSLAAALGDAHLRSQLAEPPPVLEHGAKT